MRRIETKEGVVQLSIHEDNGPPRFHLTGVGSGMPRAETIRDDGRRQDFTFVNLGTHWESAEEIPEPHQFAVSVILSHGGREHRYETRFTEHDEGHHHHHQTYDHSPDPDSDPLYLPLRGDVAVLTRHVHVHRHGSQVVHAHWHDHTAQSSHELTEAKDAAPPLHEHRHRMKRRTALLLILGSSPMVEGIPAFFAAGRYGFGLILTMAGVFALCTIATYALLCVYSTAGLQRVRLGSIERYGEVLSGAFIAIIGLVFGLGTVL